MRSPRGRVAIAGKAPRVSNSIVSFVRHHRWLCASVLLAACASSPDQGAHDASVGAASTTPPSVTDEVQRTRQGKASACAPAAGLAIQVLGSGGPRPDDERASSGYLVWVDGRAEILVDAGGGTFSHFGASRASLDDLDLIAISHLHTDHSAELPALLKGTFFGERRASTLVVSGPAAGGDFPGIEAALEGWFGPEGVYRYLSWLMKPGEGPVDLEVLSVDPQGEVTEVLSRGGLTVEATGVPHGPVPTLAYRVRHGDDVIVFGSDNNGDDPAFVEFAKGASVLVMHHAVPEDAGDVAANLHARPSEIGRIASEAEAKRLVLSHHMRRSLEKLEQSRTLIAEHYDGPVVIASDMSCIDV